MSVARQTSCLLWLGC